MDTHPDDLSDLERRLSAWRPAAQGLDADAMLFAAGQASRPRRGRLLWPALTGSLLALTVALGAWAVNERSGRLALAEQLRQPPAEAPAASPPSIVPSQEPAEEAPGPGSLLAARRALEDGLDAWPPRPIGPTVPPTPGPPVLRAGQRNALLEP